MDLSLAGLWAAMGNFAKGIVIVMALMSIYSLTIMVSKWWNLRSAQAETRKFAPEFSQFLEEDNLTEAIKLAESYKKSHVALVLGGALGEVKPLIQDGSVTVSDINSAERAVERNMLLEITQLKRGLAVLATVGATAPFVGLLGTTVGIINSFTAMAASGGGGLASIGGGISEALATTAFGLIVAISTHVPTAAHAKAPKAAAALHPDLSGFWTSSRAKNPDPGLIAELPANTVVLDDTGIAEFPQGEFGGLKIKPDALAAATKSSRDSWARAVLPSFSQRRTSEPTM